MNRLQRWPKAVIRTGLHLHKDYHATIQSDEIHLSHRAAIVPLHKLVAFPLEIPLRNQLPLFTENLFWILHTLPLAEKRGRSDPVDIS